MSSASPHGDSFYAEGKSEAYIIDLWCNKIGDFGATAIAGALRVNTTLIDLDLSPEFSGRRDWARVSDLGAKVMLRALQSNSNDSALLHLDGVHLNRAAVSCGLPNTRTKLMSEFLNMCWIVPQQR